MKRPSARTAISAGLAAAVLAGAAVAVAPVVRRSWAAARVEREFVQRYGQRKDFLVVKQVIDENRAFVRANSRNDSAYYSLCQGYYVLGALDEAIAACQQAADLKPEQDYYWSFLAKAYQGKKDYARAAEMYRQALSLNAGRSGNYTTLAWLYYFRVKDAEPQAYEVLEAGLQKFPDDRGLLFDITRYHRYDRHDAEFLKYAERYLAVNPSDETVRQWYDEVARGGQPAVPKPDEPEPRGTP